MSDLFIKIISRFVIVLSLWLSFNSQVFAAPYFYISGDTELTTGENETFQLRVNSTGDNIGVLQTAVTFDDALFNTSSISNLNSECSMWAPANSIPPGKDSTSVTPYFYNSKVVVSCGFTGSGYTGSDGLIATFTLTPEAAGTTSLSFENNYFAFLGTEITPGAMLDFNLTITGDATPSDSITPLPSVTPTTTPIPTASISATPTPIVNTTTLFDDVTFTDVTDNLTSNTSSGNTSTTGNSTLDVIEENNTVPPPPDNITPRPEATPFKVPEINYQNLNGDINGEEGDVLSAQGLRDLLIPGKSKADKTVVMINFISAIAFILLLAIMLSKMSMNSRAAKLKAKHIQELVAGELSALESKMQVREEDAGKEQFESEFSNAVSNILGGLTFEQKNNKNKNEKNK